MADQYTTWRATGWRISLAITVGNNANIDDRYFAHRAVRALRGYGGDGLVF